MTLDQDLPWTEPEPMVVVPRRTRQHRHVWNVGAYRSIGEGLSGMTWVPDSDCRCGAKRDPAKSKRGRTSRSRGNAFEREVAAALGVRRVGQYGSPTDVEGDWIAAQVKVGAAFPERIWRWLPAAKGDQLRAVVIGDAPGSAGKRRILIALDFADFVSWFGKR